jgi:hypothetical protein
VSKSNDSLTPHHSTFGDDLKRSAAIAAETMMTSIARSEGAVIPLERLLDGLGLLPEGKDDETIEKRIRLVDEAFTRLRERLLSSGVLAEAFSTAVQPSCSARLAGIRTLFLEPKADYSIAEIADLWGTPVAIVRTVFAATDYDIDDPSMRITHDDVIEFAVGNAIPAAHEIEDALGSNFSTVRAHTWRTRHVTVQLPTWLVNAITTDAGESPRATIQSRLEALLFDHYRDCAPDLFDARYLRDRKEVAHA